MRYLETEIKLLWVFIFFALFWSICFRKIGFQFLLVKYQNINFENQCDGKTVLIKTSFQCFMLTYIFLIFHDWEILIFQIFK